MNACTAAHALCEILNRTRAAKHDDRAVVDRVMHGRAGEHQPVEQCHRQAGRRPGAQRADRAAGSGAVEVHLLADACVQRGDHEGLALVREPEMRHHRLVEDRVDRLAVVAGAGRHTTNLRAWRRGGGHIDTLSQLWLPEQGQADARI